MPVEDLNEIYKPDQAVLATITDIDKEKKRFLVSLRMRDCYKGNTDIGLDILLSYLNEMDLIYKKMKKTEKGNYVYESFASFFYLKQESIETS